VKIHGRYFAAAAERYFGFDPDEKKYGIIRGGRQCATCLHWRRSKRITFGGHCYRGGFWLRLARALWTSSYRFTTDWCQHWLPDLRKL
jgi:hypothetical protein